MGKGNVETVLSNDGKTRLKGNVGSQSTLVTQAKPPFASVKDVDIKSSKEPVLMSKVDSNFPSLVWEWWESPGSASGNLPADYHKTVRMDIGNSVNSRGDSVSYSLVLKANRNAKNNWSLELISSEWDPEELLEDDEPDFATLDKWDKMGFYSPHPSAANTYHVVEAMNDPKYIVPKLSRMLKVMRSCDKWNSKLEDDLGGYLEQSDREAGRS